MMIRFIFLIVTSALTFVFAEDKGLTHFKKGEFDKAIAYYESALAEGASSDKAHFGIGTSELNKGDME